MVERENDDVEGEEEGGSQNEGHIEEETEEEEEEDEDEEEEDVDIVRDDLERGEVPVGIPQAQDSSTRTNPPEQFHMSRMQRLSATNPLRLVINGATRVPTVPSSQPRAAPAPAHAQPPLSTPTPQVSNST